MPLYVSLQKKEVAQKAWDLIGKVGESMLSSQGVGDEPVKMETKTISMVLNRQLPNDINNKLTKTKDSSVRFPSAEILFGKKAMTFPHVDTQV